MGEIVAPGNHVMLGCYRDQQATATSTGRIQKNLPGRADVPQ